MFYSKGSGNKLKTQLTPAPDAVPLDQIQARLLQQLAAELARQIRDGLRSGRLTERESELAVARRTVERLEEEARQRHLRINSEVIVSELMDIRRGITGRTPQRSLLQQVVRRVTVGRELAQIEVGFNLYSMSRLWRMPPTESELLTWHLNVSVV